MFGGHRTEKPVTNNPRRVHQYVDTARLLDELVDHLLRSETVADVRLCRAHRATLTAQLPGEGLGRIAVALKYKSHLGSVRGQPFDHGPADAATPTGHQGYLSIQSHLHLHRYEGNQFFGVSTVAGWSFRAPATSWTERSLLLL